MPDVIRTDMAVILPVIRQRLMTKFSLPEEAVIVTAEDRLPFDPLGDYYLWVRPRDQSPDDSVLEGGGRIDARMTQIVGVTLRTRYDVDEATSNLAWLIDATYGHLKKRHAIYNALIDFIPTNSNGDHLVVQPMKPQRGANPAIDPKLKEWGQSTVDWRVVYEMDLDLPGDNY